MPSFEGSHLLWLWFRFRVQQVFWPWHEHRRENRARTDVPNLPALNRGVLDLLDAGDNYRGIHPVKAAD